MATIEVRATPEGKIVHRVKVRLVGHPSQSATFERLTDAKRWAQSTEVAVRSGRYFKDIEAKKHTVADLVDKYIDEVLPTKPRNARTQKQQLLFWKQELGHLEMSNLKAPTIGAVRNRLLAKKVRGNKAMAPATVVRYLAAFSTALTAAVKDWEWIDDNPMRKVRKPKEPRGRVRHLTKEQVASLLDACKQSRNKHLYAIVLLAVSTGMRQVEILSLRWNQIDVPKQRMILQDTKNGDSRAVALAGPALKEIKTKSEAPHKQTDLLFPGRNPVRPTEIKRPWANALRKSDIDDFRFHDLRHCAASFLLESGASLGQLAEVLGHRTLQMVKRYAHLSESHSAKIVTAMNEKLFEEVA